MIFLYILLLECYMGLYYKVHKKNTVIRNVIKLRNDEPSRYYCLDGVFIYAFGFSQLSTKYETTKPPAMRVVSKKCYTK